MSHAELTLSYDGPALTNGSMDVRDLAPALLAAGNLVEAINRVVNGETATANVHVRTVSPGSFSIGLDVWVAFLQTVRDILAGPDGTAAANIVTIVTGAKAILGGVGVIYLVKWLKGQSPTAIKRKGDGRVSVELDGRQIEVDEIVARVAIDVSVRLALERVIAEPLSKEGIETVDLGSEGKLERIEKAEGYSFLAPPDREGGAYEYRFRAPFSIISLSFKEGNKWRLHDGKAAFNVTVTDNAFLERIDRSEVSFSKGDILICDVRVVTRQDMRGLKAEYFVERVIEQRHPGYQPSFFDDPEFGSPGTTRKPPDEAGN